MEWGSVIGGVCGGAVALSGALLADIQRHRARRSRDRERDRVLYYIEFALALDAGHKALREVARSAQQRLKRLQSANDAVHAANVFVTRERLLMTGATDVVVAGEDAYGQLIAIRNAVRSGADLQSAQYHSAYHSFAEAIWRFRMAVRGELDHAGFRPDDLGRASWSGRDDCEECSRTAAA